MMDPGGAVVFQAPGRSEISGNHTDHNHGRVVAAAVDRVIEAKAFPRPDLVVKIHSEGFSSWEILLNDLGPFDQEKGQSMALVRGVAAALASRGAKIGGFEAQITSAVPSGSGLSSSAAFEVLIGSIFNTFFNNETLDPMILAMAGQEAENLHFGKPCGLMDQSASALGGIVALDFKDPKNPKVQRLTETWESWGLELFVIQTGGSHADLTEAYADIPREMKSAAAAMGQEVLAQVSYQDFIRELPRLRGVISPRALLRTLHFFHEDMRAGQLPELLKSGGPQDFLRSIKDSGISSWRFLQNTISPEGPQDLALCLAWAENFLGADGAARIHGGGFAGTIQAFVPADRGRAFKEHMEKLTGPESVLKLKVRQRGSGKVLP